MNLCLATDSYKTTHHVQYPPGTTKIYSYLESRGGRFHETVFFGLQPILAKIAGEGTVLPTDVEESREILAMHFGSDKLFNLEGWRHIVQDHSGRLPLSIKAVPEGTVVGTHNVLMTIENTCPRCYWLTNYMETLLMQVWYPITVATLSREIKKVITGYLKKQGSSAESANFKLHDFGYRGVSSHESAAIGGVAHLVNFMGTDTLAAVLMARKFYREPCAGYSIPASEHSTMTSWGGPDKEVDAFRNMLKQYPTGLMACVSDSYDIEEACRDKWGTILKDEVIARDGGLVIRPDSGNPVQVVLKILKILGDAFGTTTTQKGYKLLHPKVRIIQGDGVNYDTITEILRQMDQNDWAADNVAFGMGGALLQKIDRDTQKMAIKCSYIEGETFDEATWKSGRPMMDGGVVKWHRDVFKQPKTDAGKNSKRGRLKLVKREDGFHTESAGLSDAKDELIEVFRDGEVLAHHTLAEVRERAAL